MPSQLMSYGTEELLAAVSRLVSGLIARENFGLCLSLWEADILSGQRCGSAEVRDASCGGKALRTQGARLNTNI